MLSQKEVTPPTNEHYRIMGCNTSTIRQEIEETHDQVAPKALLDALYLRNIEDARQLLRRPDAIRLVEFHDSVLCEACQGNAPIDIIRSIYYLSPGQVLHKNRYGFTPLHYACFAASTDDVRHFLLKVAPQATHMPDDKDHLPLHAAIRSRKNIAFIDQLLFAYPEALTTRAQDGNTPFELFLLTWTHTLEKIWNRHGGFINIPLDNKDFQKGHLAKDIFLILLKTLMCKEIDRNDNSKTKWLPAHKALSIKEIPAIFKQLIVELMPQEGSKKDQKGNLLLHLALTSKYQDQLNYDLIDFICRYNPESAMEPNDNGDYPLELAIQNGWEWDVVKSLHMAAPDVISRPSRKNGLYPFMFSLCCSNSSLDNGYSLLRLDPSIIKFMGHPNSICDDKYG